MLGNPERVRRRVLVVVNNLDIVRIAGNQKRIGPGERRRVGQPSEANSVLRIDPDTVLAVPITAQGVEPVRRRRAKIA